MANITKIMETTEPPIKRARILGNRRPSEHQRDMAEQFGEWREDHEEEQGFARAIRGKKKLKKAWSEKGRVAANKPLPRCSTLAETASERN